MMIKLNVLKIFAGSTTNTEVLFVVANLLVCCFFIQKRFIFILSIFL